MMIEVVVSKLGVDPSNQSYVVVLQEKGGGRMLPIWIGQVEAESIVMQMHNMKRSRPLTHDLCKSIILATGSELRRVQITRVESNTYFGELHLDRDGKSLRVDSRPSDAIAIALRLDAPIYASDALLVSAEEEEEPSEFSVPPDTGARDSTELSAEQLKEYLEQLRPEDFGKFNP
jgi:bifunctional DNase/RNase